MLPFFRWWFRYIDDLLIINGAPPKIFLNPNMSQHQDSPYWIHSLHILSMTPEVVEWSKDLVSRIPFGSKVHYLSFTLTITDRTQPMGYGLFRYVKRKTLPFPTSQYVRYASNRPVSFVCGIVKSQMLPFLYVNSSL